ncbi:glycosyltransferase family 4 protein [Nocardioides nanhaiensis]|uniref:Glycosyltransferase n=1 Tax=Nocardioides nanhaiensis TaxID=1476871 RepID=A0ABP8VRR5_9ACTN
MRVLFVNENIGGHATVHAHLRATLEAHPEVLPTWLDVPPPTLLRRVVGASLPGLGGLDLDLQPLRAQLALSAWVRRRLVRLAPQHDVLHVYTGNAGLRSASLLAAHPTVVSTDATNTTNAYRLPYREPTRFTPHALRLSHRVEKPVYDAATLLAASTGWAADSLRGDYGQPADKVRLLPFGIVAPDLPAGPAPGTRPAPGRLPQVVFVGRQLERKGALRLLRLHQEHLAEECELVLVTTEQAPPGRNVRVVDDVRVGSGRLWEVLCEAAVFAFPSAIDQASNAVIEGMAAGLPVLGLEQGAMPEMVPPDVGRLVPVDDDGALVSALRELVRDADLRARLGAAGRQRFETTYDARVSTGRLVALLHEARELHAGRGNGS